MTEKEGGRAADKAGLPPGSLVYVGRRSHPTRLRVIAYDEDRVRDRALEATGRDFPLHEEAAVTWLDVTGLRDVDVLERIGRGYRIHPLVLEDILNTGQRPRVELFDDSIFLVLKMVNGIGEDGRLDLEQVSLLLEAGSLITVQEKEGDVFGPVRQRLRAGQGRIRRAGADYLAYSLMDAVVDRYFTVLEEIGEQIEQLEDVVVFRPGPTSVGRLHHLRRNLIVLRRAVWPLREELAALMREQHDLIDPATLPYLRDLYDHVLRVIETIETGREMIAGLLDVYLSSVSNRLNEVMKVLTIIATIFIPMTFLTGVYGMNFRHMPELDRWWGYPAVWLVNLGIAGTMLLFFRRKKWL